MLRSIALLLQFQSQKGPQSSDLKIDKREEKGGQLVQSWTYILLLFFVCCEALAGQIYTEGKRRERERVGESKLQLAEVFGLNSENDPFNSDGL